MWKIIHKLFGTEYVYWTNGQSNRICKVYKTKEGRYYIKPYFLLSDLLFLDELKPDDTISVLT